MTAAVLYGKEDVKIERVPIPELEKGEVLIRVQAALTCGTDLKVYRRGYHAKMIVPPALFGHEFAGVIEETGPGVKNFKAGQRVVALNSAPCGQCFYCKKHQENLCEDLLFNNGAYAEFIRIPRRIVENNMLVVPKDISFETAALTEPLACVLRGLHETGVEIGETVAVIGAGPIGLMFIQVAHIMGCDVVAVVKHDEQVLSAKHAGASKVVQYLKVANPIEAVRDLTPERRVRRMRQGNPRAVEHRASALLGDHGEGYLPSHAGYGTPGVCADCRAQDQRRRLHHRGSAALQAADRVAGYADTRWRDQNCDYSRTLIREDD
jgi:L-iditol 2-dehydrogenase